MHPARNSDFKTHAEKSNPTSRTDFSSKTLWDIFFGSPCKSFWQNWSKNKISTLNFHFLSDFLAKTSRAKETINIQNKTLKNHDVELYWPKLTLPYLFSRSPHIRYILQVWIANLLVTAAVLPTDQSKHALAGVLLKTPAFLVVCQPN